LRGARFFKLLWGSHTPSSSPLEGEVPERSAGDEGVMAAGAMWGDSPLIDPAFAKATAGPLLPQGEKKMCPGLGGKAPPLILQMAIEKFEDIVPQMHLAGFAADAVALAGIGHHFEIGAGFLEFGIQAN
jgi:hypothetical protein